MIFHWSRDFPQEYSRFPSQPRHLRPATVTVWGLPSWSLLRSGSWPRMAHSDARSGAPRRRGAKRVPTLIGAGVPLYRRQECSQGFPMRNARPYRVSVSLTYRMVGLSSFRRYRWCQELRHAPFRRVPDFLSRACCRIRIRALAMATPPTPAPSHAGLGVWSRPDARAVRRQSNRHRSAQCPAESCAPGYDSGTH